MPHPTPPQGACAKSLRLLPPSRSASLVVTKSAYNCFSYTEKQKVAPLLLLSPKTKTVFGDPIQKSSSSISGKPPQRLRRLPLRRRHAYQKRPFFQESAEIMYFTQYKYSPYISHAKPSLPKGGGTVEDGGRIPEGDRHISPLQCLPCVMGGGPPKVVEGLCFPNKEQKKKDA